MPRDNEQSIDLTVGELRDVQATAALTSTSSGSRLQTFARVRPLPNTETKRSREPRMPGRRQLAQHERPCDLGCHPGNGYSPGQSPERARTGGGSCSGACC
jgi:hypothetical protein